MKKWRESAFGRESQKRMKKYKEIEEKYLQKRIGEENEEMRDGGNLPSAENRRRE